MFFKISEMMNHDNTYIRRIGFSLYDKNNGEDGLSKDELEEIIDLIIKANDEEDSVCDECPYSY